jgi:hypothetical protein
VRYELTPHICDVSDQRECRYRVKSRTHTRERLPEDATKDGPTGERRCGVVLTDPAFAGTERYPVTLVETNRISDYIEISITDSEIISLPPHIFRIGLDSLNFGLQFGFS